MFLNLTWTSIFIYYYYSRMGPRDIHLTSFLAPYLLHSLRIRLYFPLIRPLNSFGVLLALSPLTNFPTKNVWLHVFISNVCLWEASRSYLLWISMSLSQFWPYIDFHKTQQSRRLDGFIL